MRQSVPVVLVAMGEHELFFAQLAFDSFRRLVGMFVNAGEIGFQGQDFLQQVDR
jgi:hypothetical protein